MPWSFDKPGGHGGRPLHKTARPRRRPRRYDLGCSRRTRQPFVQRLRAAGVDRPVGGMLAIDDIDGGSRTSVSDRAADQLPIPPLEVHFESAAGAQAGNLARAHCVGSAGSSSMRAGPIAVRRGRLHEHLDDPGTATEVSVDLEGGMGVEQIVVNAGAFAGELSAGLAGASRFWRIL